MTATRASASRRTRDIDLEHDDVTNEFLINGTTWHDVQAGYYNVFADDGGDPAPARRPTRSGGSRTTPAAGSTRSTSTSWTSGSSDAAAGPAGVEAWEKGAKDVVYVGEGEMHRGARPLRMPPACYPDGRSDRPGRCRRAPRWSLHDPLPQPAARGPRHDGPVPRRAPRTATARPVGRTALTTRSTPLPRRGRLTPCRLLTTVRHPDASGPGARGRAVRVRVGLLTGVSTLRRAGRGPATLLVRALWS